MRSFFTKKRSFVALAAVAVLAIAGAAFAFYTTSGSGSGNAAAGSDTGNHWTVTASPAVGNMLPGSTSDYSTITFTLTNNSTSTGEKLGVTPSEVTPSMASAPDPSDSTKQDVVGSDGNPVSGCLASWFTPTVASGFTGDVAPSGAVTGTVKVTMSDSGTNQDPCQGVSPQVNLAVVS